MKKMTILVTLIFLILACSPLSLVREEEVTPRIHVDPCGTGAPLANCYRRVGATSCLSLLPML